MMADAFVWKNYAYKMVLSRKIWKIIKGVKICTQSAQVQHVQCLNYNIWTGPASKAILPCSTQ